MAGSSTALPDAVERARSHIGIGFKEVCPRVLVSACGRGQRALWQCANYECIPVIVLERLRTRWVRTELMRTLHRISVTAYLWTRFDKVSMLRSRAASQMK
jgi:hypothetical protein